MLSQRFRLATLMLILSGPTYAADTPVADPSQQMTDARAAIDAGDYTTALTTLSAVVAADPRNADALNLMGYASRKMGNIPGRACIAQHCRTSGTSRPEAFYFKA